MKSKTALIDHFYSQVVIRWAKSSIRKVWDRFKVFLVKVADLAHSVKKTVANLVQKVMRGISDLKDKFKLGLKKLFLIFTKKRNQNGQDNFKDIIEEARKEGKIGTEDISGTDIFGAVASEFDIHIVQTDSDYNTENVYSISAEKLSADLRAKAAAHEVSEINITGI